MSYYKWQQSKLIYIQKFNNVNWTPWRFQGGRDYHLAQVWLIYPEK